MSYAKHRLTRPALLCVVILCSAPLWASPLAPPPPPPSPAPLPSNPCVAGDAVASIRGRATQRGWTCGPVEWNVYGATASHNGGSYTTSPTSAADCGSIGIIVWNPNQSCAYTMVKGILAGPAAGKIYDSWAGSAEVRAFVGYPVEDGIPLKANPSQRFQYGHLANNSTDWAAVVIGGRATVTGNPATSVRFPSSSAGNATAQLQSFLNAWTALPGFTGGSYTGYKRPWGHTLYQTGNGGGFVMGTDGTYIGGANDATVAVKSGASAAYFVAGAIQDYWVASSGNNGFLKWPMSSNAAVAGGEYVPFEGATSAGCPTTPCAALYRSAATGTRLVDGRLLKHYQSVGGPSTLGFPIENPSGPAYPRIQRFQYGTITATFPSRSYVVSGWINQYWLAHGGQGGFLGWPSSDAHYSGRYQAFERGTVYQKGGSTLAFGVEGPPLSPILGKYLALGGPGGYLGYPTNTAPNSGTSFYPRTQTFEHGSITATSATTTLFEPNAPGGFYISGWGSNTATLTWTNLSAPQTLVKHRVNGGPWTTIHVYGELAHNTLTTYTDSGATPDAENCYRAVGTDGTTEAPSPLRCVYTRDGRGIPVSRLQLRIRVPNGPVGGGLWPDTDEPVQVRLQSPAWLQQWRPAGNSTWLDSHADDFEMGSNRTYDLRLAGGQLGVRDASDITMITIDVPGGSLCIAELELLVDNTPAFQRSYGSCAWARDGEPLTIGFNELRAHPLWQALNPQPFVGFDEAGFISLIDAKFGNALHDDGGRLRDGHTAILQADDTDDTRMHVTEHIIAKDSWLGEINATVDFDLVLYPQPGGPTQIHVENIDPESEYGWIPFFDSLVSLLFMPVLEYVVDVHIQTAMEQMGGADLGVPAEGFRFCFRDPNHIWEPGLSGACLPLP